MSLRSLIIGVVAILLLPSMGQAAMDNLAARWLAVDETAGKK